MNRKIDYQWHLDELMHRHRLNPRKDLQPLLAERGVSLSASQAYRLVSEQPERVSLKLLVALMDIFNCGFEDLITYTATDVRARAAAGGPVVDLSAVARPKRARILQDGDE